MTIRDDGQNSINRDQTAAQGRLAAIEALIVQCEEGPPDYNEWPWDSTIKAARAAFDALVKEAE